MRFLRTAFFNIPLEVTVIRTLESGLEGAPLFRSFMLHGNDNHPARLDLYASQQPPYNEFPIATYERVDGVLRLRQKEEVVRKKREAAFIERVPVDAGPMVYREEIQ